MKLLLTAASHIVHSPATAGLTAAGAGRISGRSEGSSPACLTAAVHDSHSVLSLKCSRGPPRAYLSLSFKTNLGPRCPRATTRRSSVHLRYHSPFRTPWMSPLPLPGPEFSQSFIMCGCFNTVSSCTMGAFIWRPGMGWTIRVRLKPARLYAKCQRGLLS